LPCDTKHLAGQTNKSNTSSSLLGLANKFFIGCMAELAAVINTSLQQVSDDLTRLTDQDLLPVLDFPYYLKIEPYEVSFRLYNINTRKLLVLTAFQIGFYMILPAFSVTLCVLFFNSSIREGFVPAVWKQANVIPIP
jgi:hypothetical protein